MRNIHKQLLFMDNKDTLFQKYLPYHVCIIDKLWSHYMRDHLSETPLYHEYGNQYMSYPKLIDILAAITTIYKSVYSVHYIFIYNVAFQQ